MGGTCSAMSTFALFLRRRQLTDGSMSLGERSLADIVGLIEGARINEAHVVTPPLATRIVTRLPSTSPLQPSAVIVKVRPKRTI